VVVTGSPDERSLVERIVAGAGLPNTAVFAGRLDLVELAAVVAHARLVVSTDTGLAHLATAYRTPSVVLFGPVRPDLWGPPPDRPWHRPLHSTPAGKPSTGDGGWDRIHPALAAIEVEEVLTAADEVERAGRGCGAAAT
jgi:ADP-heptose:LPS heptosyltransferase